MWSITRMGYHTTKKRIPDAPSVRFQWMIDVWNLRQNEAQSAWACCVELTNQARLQRSTDVKYKKGHNDEDPNRLR